MARHDFLYLFTSREEVGLAVYQEGIAKTSEFSSIFLRACALVSTQPAHMHDIVFRASPDWRFGICLVYVLILVLDRRSLRARNADVGKLKRRWLYE